MHVSFSRVSKKCIWVTFLFGFDVGYLKEELWKERLGIEYMSALCMCYMYECAVVMHAETMFCTQVSLTLARGMLD